MLSAACINIFQVHVETLSMVILWNCAGKVQIMEL
jgi:hypothetical protein